MHQGLNGLVTSLVTGQAHSDQAISVQWKDKCPDSQEDMILPNPYGLVTGQAAEVTKPARSQLVSSNLIHHTCQVQYTDNQSLAFRHVTWPRLPVKLSVKSLNRSLHP